MMGQKARCMLAFISVAVVLNKETVARAACVARGFANWKFFPRQQPNPARQCVCYAHKAQLKILSWNVASLRSMMRRDGGAELSLLLQSEQPDITFLQEHKLQDINVAELEPKVLQIFNRACFGEHRAAWAVSTARKGYSGVCAIFRDSAGGGVSKTTAGEIDQVDAAEGRSVRLDLECGLIVIGMYVPNSGQKLARLDYRVNVWDVKLRSYLRDLDRKAGRRGGLVICGDFNVAHQDIDIWNPEAHQIKRQAEQRPQSVRALRIYSKS